MRFIKFLLVSILLSISIYATQWKVVRDAGTSIKVPEEWHVVDLDQSIVQYIVYITEEDKHEFFDNINLTYEDTGSIITQGFIELSFAQTISMLESLYEKVEVIEKGEDYLIIDGVLDGNKLTQKIVVYHHDTKIYFLTFTVARGTLEQYRKVFTMIENSFKILK